MDSTDKPLRILVVVNLPWDARLGACRVWMELAEQWRALGHTVEKFSLSDAFPGVRATRVTFALRQFWFIRKAAAFVRQNRQRFDVIDALIGTLPYSKNELGFRGIIVARSVGLYRFYDRFERSIERRWPRPRRGTFAGKWLYWFSRQGLLRASERAVERADLLNVPNEDEAACLRAETYGRTPISVIPYGLTESMRNALANAAAPPEARLAQKRICFIGMWSARKGAHDWREIIERVRREIPEARFRFLGTMIEAERIKSEIGSVADDGIELISDFSSEQLPNLLADCTVGAFPSYVEGFGLAVIEQLAAAIPTVAYDTAGPRDILQKDLPNLLVPSGDLERFAAALCEVMRIDRDAYAALGQRSRAIAAQYSWPEIAQQTLQTYQELLRSCA